MIQDVLQSIQCDDTVDVSGVGNSGRRFTRLRGVVATVDRSEEEWAIKVWPLGREPDGSEIEGGKVWFVASKIESIEVVERGEL